MQSTSNDLSSPVTGSVKGVIELLKNLTGCWQNMWSAVAGMRGCKSMMKVS